MSVVFVDTSCIVALSCGWHEAHSETRDTLGHHGSAGDTLVTAAHALLEAFSVLTRLPPPHRLRPADALEVLAANWKARDAVALSPAETWSALADAARAGVSGGLAYDFAIAACARKARADMLLTWNVEHFARFDLPGIAVRAPGR